MVGAPSQAHVSNAAVSLFFERRSELSTRAPATSKNRRLQKLSRSSIPSSTSRKVNSSSNVAAVQGTQGSYRLETSALLDK
ncbi:MAG: hypothetical protein BJ554DRAFT_2687 [Olpidium bornovanus]|uniref:Uncharacterized protein n=1 Tax=Olpidium bornovanus TaxID=278681 RepID=A0A8H7ZQ45_9FUNG|nr:MAG: hypothetical protein BJ554DRAFT_2687 [Olpidium bornovanus]